MAHWRQLIEGCCLLFLLLSTAECVLLDKREESECEGKEIV